MDDVRPECVIPWQPSLFRSDKIALKATGHPLLQPTLAAWSAAEPVRCSDAVNKTAGSTGDNAPSPCAGPTVETETAQTVSDTATDIFQDATTTVETATPQTVSDTAADIFLDAADATWFEQEMNQLTKIKSTRQKKGKEINLAYDLTAGKGPSPRPLLPADYVLDICGRSESAHVILRVVPGVQLTAEEILHFHRSQQSAGPVIKALVWAARVKNRVKFDVLYPSDSVRANFGKKSTWGSLSSHFVRLPVPTGASLAN